MKQRPTTVVYIATSLDGFISRTDGTFDWLTPVNDEGVYQRFEAFLKTIDAIVMGRNTFVQVVAFEQWPYHDIPVYVLSGSLTELPDRSPGTVQLRNCSPQDLLAELASRSIHRVYVDGGKTVANFFAADLIDELTITRVPIILGSGRTLFGQVPYDLNFQHVSTEAFAPGTVQSKYLRIRVPGNEFA